MTQERTAVTAGEPNLLGISGCLGRLGLGVQVGGFGIFSFTLCFGVMAVMGFMSITSFLRKMVEIGHKFSSVFIK